MVQFEHEKNISRNFVLIFTIFCNAHSHITCTYHLYSRITIMTLNSVAHFFYRAPLFFCAVFKSFFFHFFIHSHYFPSPTHFVLTSKNTCSWYYQRDRMLYYINTDSAILIHTCMQTLFVLYVYIVDALEVGQSQASVLNSEKKTELKLKFKLLDTCS